MVKNLLYSKCQHSYMVLLMNIHIVKLRTIINRIQNPRVINTVNQTNRLKIRIIILKHDGSSLFNPSYAITILVSCIFLYGIICLQCKHKLTESRFKQPRLIIRNPGNRFIKFHAPRVPYLSNHGSICLHCIQSNHDMLNHFNFTVRCCRIQALSVFS